MTTITCKYCRSLGAAVAVLIGELWAAQVQAADYDVGPIHTCPAMGAGNAEGSQIRRWLPDYHQQRLDGGSAQLCLQRRRRQVPGPHHDHGKWRHENAAGGGRP